MKYIETLVTFAEVPDEITLCINISNCPNHCPGCHSKWLWDDVGMELTKEELDKLLNKETGITCVGFMGGDAEPEKVEELCNYVKKLYKLKTAWYTGKTKLPDELEAFDYIKIGPYIEEFGPLTNKNTNQIFYKIEGDKVSDITERFWK